MLQKKQKIVLIGYRLCKGGDGWNDQVRVHFVMRFFGNEPVRDALDGRGGNRSLMWLGHHVLVAWEGRLLNGYAHRLEVVEERHFLRNDLTVHDQHMLAVRCLR